MKTLLGELQPVVAPVDCSGQRHRMRWAAGDLTALDHDDPDGERALIALGGPRCACLDVLEAWSRQRGSTRLLSALSRGTRDLVRPAELGMGPGFQAQRAAMLRAGARRGSAQVAHGVSNWISTSSGIHGTATLGSVRGPVGLQMGPQESAASDLGVLANLGYPMTLRLVATVTATLLGQPGTATDSSVLPALTASLFGRSLIALRDWLGVPDLDIELTIADAADEPTVGLGTSAPLRVVLPLDWVVSVWARDLTVVAGRFCLGVIESTETRTTLLGVGSDFETPRRLMIELQ